MVKYIGILDFLELRERMVTVDVRSPSEFAKGHIPGAKNIPLFTDEERVLVGTTYKQKGRMKAIKQGLEIVGPQMLSKLEAAQACVGSQKEMIVHCWRGGMRSENMAWLFSRADIDCYILEGGYKTYRTYGREKLSKPKQLFVLGGLTGSGKTDILHVLEEKGEQLIDLEKLANHKGSAFGTIGENPQHQTEFFENLLFEQLFTKNLNAPIWLEDESRTIGRNYIPDEFFSLMRSSPVLKLEMDKKHRVQRLVNDYVNSNLLELRQAVEKIRKRLGGLATQKALDFLDQGDFSSAAHIILAYYDKTYLYGLSKRQPETIHPVPVAHDNPEENAHILLDYAYSKV